MTVSANGITRHGTLSGRSLAFTATYDEDGGEVTTQGTVTFNASADAYSGSSNWSWTDGTLTCNGSSTIEGSLLQRASSDLDDEPDQENDALQNTRLSVLQTARFGSTGSAAGSTAGFALGVSRDGGQNYSTSLTAGSVIQLDALIVPEQAHVGTAGDLYVVNRITTETGDSWLMLNSDGIFVPWNGRVPALAPFQEQVSLSSAHEIKVYQGSVTVPGRHKFFVGYLPESGSLLYTPAPLTFTVEAGTANDDQSSSAASFGINQTATGDQQHPRIGVADNGNFVVAWQSTGQGNARFDENLYARLFDASGQALSDEFRVNEALDLGGFDINFAVDMNSSGEFCIGWGGTGDEVAGIGAYARCYDENGTDRSGLLVVSTASDAGLEPQVDIAMDGSGGFLMVYQFERNFTTGLKARRYDRFFNASGEYWIDSEGGWGRSNDPAISMNPVSGDYAVVWTINDINIKSLAKLYSGNDQALTDSFLLGDKEGFTEAGVQVALAADGSFAAVWVSDSSATRPTLIGQVFDSSGNLSGAEEILAATGGNQNFPAISLRTSNSTQELLVVWEENSSETDWQDIYYSSFSYPGLATVATPQIVHPEYNNFKQERPSLAVSNAGIAIAWDDSTREEDERDDKTANKGIYAVVLP
ncbi:MAG: hypothetical protein RQ899_00440 [Pseudomonadales bacterium]|nr:hypothetical protein [Pseudomonadales bacterium]